MLDPLRHRRPDRFFFAASLTLLLLALIVRVAWLDVKPPHFDEGVNGSFTDSMTVNGFYAYDPTNFHGPLHFYALFVSTKLFGRNLWALRMPVVLVGVACVGLALLFARWFGKGPALFAAAALAISPAFVFFGRYSIHEIWQVFFLMLGTLAIFRIWDDEESTNPGRFFGLALAGLITTKETWIIHVGTALIAVGILWAVGQMIPRLRWDCRLPTSFWSQMRVAIPWALIPVLLLFSGFLLNPKGLIDLISSFAAWIETGTSDEAGHSKPFFYWLSLMTIYEWGFLLGLPALLLAWIPGDARVRWFALTSAGVFLAYSLISYKTPWCVIAMLWPFPFLIGVGLQRFAHRTTRWMGWIVAWSGVAGMFWPMVRVNYQRPTDPEEPYVYVQTFEEIDEFVGPLMRRVERDPSTTFLEGFLFASDFYPLPWLLGDFTRVGYYKPERPPSVMTVDFFMVEESLVEEVEKSLGDRYFKRPFRLRDAQPACVAYFRASLFAEEFAGEEPDFIPEEKSL